MIQILLLGAQAHIRAELRQAIEPRTDMHIHADTGDCRHAVFAVSQGHIDLAVVDLSVPWRPGIEIVRDFKRIRPEMKTLIVTSGRKESVALLALQAGADGCIAVENAGKDLLRTISLLADGGRYICPSIAQSVATMVLNRRPPAMSTPEDRPAV